MQPEFRVYLLAECLINPVPEAVPVAKTKAIPLLGLFAPKLIEMAIVTLESQRRSNIVREDCPACRKEIATISKIASLVYCGENEEEDDEDEDEEEEEEEKKRGEEEKEDDDEDDDEEEEPVWTASTGGPDFDGDI